MSRRINIELTSQRDENTWTWRAVGAKEPKGVLDATLLGADAKVGDHLRAEADFEIDGIFISEVMAPKARSGRPDAERIELLGKPTEGGVTTRLAKKKANKKKGRGSRRDGAPGAKDDTADSGDKRNRDKRNREKDNREKGNREKGNREKGNRDRGKSRNRKERKPDDDLPRTPKAPRLRPRQTHRKAFIESLPPEEQIVAENLQKGGIAAVRAEIKNQNEQADSKINADELIALSESLLQKLRAAEWQDRADAALEKIDDVDLRDLRTVLVAAEDFARDAKAREQVEKIRAGLNERLDRSQTEWHDELRKTIEAGRVVRALKLSSRPPKPGVPLPPDLAKQLAEQANAALGTGTTQQRLAIVLEAVAYSAVRPYVVLSSVPETPEAELVEMVTKLSGRIPEIAKQLGINVPSKPGADKTGTNKTGTNKTSAAKAGTAKAAGGKPDADKTDSGKTDSDKAGTDKTDAAKAGTAKADAAADGDAPTQNATTADPVEQNSVGTDPTAQNTAAADEGASPENAADTGKGASPENATTADLTAQSATAADPAEPSSIGTDPTAQNTADKS